MIATTEVIPADQGPDIEAMDRADSLAIWNGYLQKFEELKASADAVLTADPANPTNSKLARVARLSLRAARIEIEKKRKELGDYHLRKTQSINSEANKLKALIEPYEEKLQAIEDYAERMESERLAKLAQERTSALSEFTTISPAINYAALTEEEFAAMLNDARLAHEARIAEAKRIEEERIAKEKADAEAREAQRLENERLRKEAAEKDAALKAEREAAEKARIEAETKARKEREAIEAKARVEREAAEAKAKAEREAMEKLEAKIAADLAAKKAEEERIRKEREKAEKKAKAAPDKQKLIAFAATVRALVVPEMSTEAGKTAGVAIAGQVEGFAKWIEGKIAEVEK